MRINIKSLLFLFAVISGVVGTAQNHLIIPQPVSMSMLKGNFIISPKTVLVANDAEDG